MKSKFKNYLFPIILIASILIGSCIGIFAKDTAVHLKPLGDIFLNLVFMLVVPLVFTSIVAAIANANRSGKFKKIIFSMMTVFLGTGIIAAVYMLIVVKLFPQFSMLSIVLEKAEASNAFSWGEQIVGIFTTDSFLGIFDRSNMMALIIFSVLMGISIHLAGDKGKPLANVMESASQVMLKMMNIVMYYAPIGLGAYFAHLTATFGAVMLEEYIKIFILYTIASLVFFFVMYTVYAFIAAGKRGVVVFWKNMLAPAATAIGTCSSMATLPVNIKANEQMGVPKEISETTLPLAVSMHKDGSVMGLILKISVLFSVFNMEFNGVSTIVTALGLAILGGTLMGAIPNGGMIAETLLISLYGLPMEALPVLAAISTIIDAPATLLNATGDNTTTMLVARQVEGKDWLTSSEIATEPLITVNPTNKLKA